MIVEVALGRATAVTIGGLGLEELMVVDEATGKDVTVFIAVMTLDDGAVEALIEF